MYNIAICDDDQVYIQYMKKLIITCGFDDVVNFYEYYSGEELVADFKNHIDYDVLILDMQMSGMDGNQTAKQFRLKYSNSILVFCSGLCQPTVKSFEVSPFRYLLKQYTDKKMIQELRCIIDLVKSKKTEPYIVGTYHYNSIKLKPEEILYIEVAKHGCSIHINPNIVKYDFESHILSKSKLESLYNDLKTFGFVYAHNSYIVNINYIKRKTLTELELIDGSILSISRSKEKELRKVLAEYLSKKY